MAKQKEIPASLSASSEEELIALRARVAELELKDQNGSGANDSNLVKEMAAIRKIKGNGLNEIQVQDNFPKRIFLWHVSGHNVGKRIGPLEATNAEDTFMRFNDFGIRISLNKPSEAWIEEYKKTKEYIDSAEVERVRRASKNKSTKEGQVDRLLGVMEKQFGLGKESLASIRPESEVTRRK